MAKWTVWKKGPMVRIEKEGFHWLGLLFGVIYLPFKGLWKHFLQFFGLVVFLCIILALISGQNLQFYNFMTSVAGILIATYVGFKTHDWLEEKYIENGFKKLGTFNTKNEAKEFISKISK